MTSQLGVDGLKNNVLLHFKLIIDSLEEFLFEVLANPETNPPADFLRRQVSCCYTEKIIEFLRTYFLVFFLLFTTF
jgi:hypothetical protein